jgi:nicotinate-nucleotide adenylyltransferase
MNLKTLALFGGSFDPIHQGHVQIALDIQNEIHFNRFFFLPCGQPALKNSCQTSAKQRLDMLKLALAEHPQFEISEQELWQEKTTYTIESLINWRKTLGEKVSISFILGEDAMALLMQWKRWTELLNYCHLIYHHRPMLKSRFPSDLKHYIETHRSTDLRQLKTKANGLIFTMQLNHYPISSTMIRQAIKEHQPVYGLDDKVLHYIKTHHLYPNENQIKQ